MKQIICLFILIINLLPISAQISVGGVANEYYKVVGVGAGNTVTCDGTEDLSTLNPGDKVILIQMTGVTISPAAPIDWFMSNRVGDIKGFIQFNGTGKFEYLSVLNVNNGSKEVTFTANLKRIYQASEKIQLVKIIESEIVNVTSELTAMPWNGDKGGVVAVVGYKKVVLNNNINVSNKGFRGAAIEPFSIGCRPYADPDTMFFNSALLNRGGIKGEGVFSTTFNMNKGPGPGINGGGGGSGYHGGGGGGSLYADGGPGGAQSQVCPFSWGQVSQGGVGLGAQLFRRNQTGDDNYPALILGGGGGTSTQTAGFTATPGGNGGGIIIVLTDTLITNNYSLISQGGSVTGTASAGGGGGGAGGAIVIDADAVRNTLNINTAGGNGGATDINCGGPGGGGSGGLLWHNNTSINGTVVSVLSPGLRGGRNTGCAVSGNDPGQTGVTLNNYVPLLNGFTFNAVTGDDTICYNQVPNMIIGTRPKGVTAPVYQWLVSNNNVTWSVISGATSKDYQPGALPASRYYTRIVTNDDGYSDTALSCYIHVFPLITDNIIQVRDTVCRNIAPGLLAAQAVAGGNGVYAYNWQTSTISNSNWTNRSTAEVMSETTKLTETTFYRRIVESGNVCYDTSLHDTITVLPLITSNSIVSPDTTICSGLSAGTIRGSTSLGGGDGTYRAAWLLSTNNVTYNPIAGATSLNYSPPGVLTATRYYKRIIYSGNDNACKDTTPAHTITVLPALANYNISSDSTRYCSGTTPHALTGQLPTGGAGAGTYLYQWYRLNGAVWNKIPGAVSQNYSPGALTDTATFRRFVVSGADSACKANSNSLVIRIIPPIQNVLLTAGDTLCQGQLPIYFNESAATGGAGTGSYTYLWQTKIDFGGTWTPASTQVMANNLASYQSPGIDEENSTFFRRIVTSHICQTTSNEIEVFAYRSVSKNTILGGAEQYGCYKSSKTLNGDVPEGGIPGFNLFNYYWHSSADGVSWSTAPGSSTNEDYFIPTLDDTTFYRRLVFIGSKNECRDTSDFVEVRPNQLPQGDLVSSSDTLCAGETISIAIDFLSGHGPWTINLGDTDTLHTQTVNNSGEVLSFLLNSSANIRILKLQDDSTCKADLALMDGLVKAAVYEIPVANAGEDFDACGLTAQLNAIPSVAGSYGEWQVASGSLDPADSFTSAYTVGSYGSYTINWKEETWRECFSSDDLIVTFFEQPIDINAGEDISIPYETNSAQLQAQDPVIGGGTWTFISDLKGTFTDSTAYNATAEDMVTVGSYTLRWNVANGPCTVLTDELVISKNDIVLYQGFSPNSGDNINDLYIVNLSEGVYGEFIILDGNGNQVKNLSGTGQIIWDGTNEKGNYVPTGTYYYILKEGNNKPRRGYIVLRR